MLYRIARQILGLEVLSVTKVACDDGSPDPERVRVHEHEVGSLPDLQSAHLVVQPRDSGRVGRHHADGIGKGDLLEGGGDCLANLRLQRSFKCGEHLLLLFK